MNEQFTVDGMTKLMGVEYRQKEKHIGLEEAKVYENLKGLINTIEGNEINAVTEAVSDMFLLLLTIPKNEAQRYLLILQAQLLKTGMSMDDIGRFVVLVKTFSDQMKNIDIEK